MHNYYDYVIDGPYLALLWGLTFMHVDAMMMRQGRDGSVTYLECGFMGWPSLRCRWWLTRDVVTYKTIYNIHLS